MHHVDSQTSVNTLVYSSLHTEHHTLQVLQKQNVHFMVSLRTAALSHGKAAFTGPARDSCRARGHHRIHLHILCSQVIRLATEDT